MDIVLESLLETDPFAVWVRFRCVEDTFDDVAKHVDRVFTVCEGVEVVELKQQDPRGENAVDEISLWS